jgi:hypothetical protein
MESVLGCIIIYLLIDLRMMVVSCSQQVLFSHCAGCGRCRADTVILLLPPGQGALAAAAAAATRHAAVARASATAGTDPRAYP